TAMVRDGSVYESDKVVRAAFTKEVWKDKAKDALAKPPSDDEAWILGATPQTGEQIQQDLQREYYGQYIREWTNLLSSVELRPVRPGASTLVKKVLAGGGRERVDLALYEGRLKGFAKDVEGAKDPAGAALVAKTLRAEAGNLTSVIGNQQHGALYESVLEQLW